jgi:hypothetical protein
VGPEFDWGAGGIQKTFTVSGDRDRVVDGEFAVDLKGRAIAALPVYYPLAVLFVRIETARVARSFAPDLWQAHLDECDARGWPDEPDDDDADGDGVREPRRPRPSADGAAARIPPPAA